MIDKKETSTITITPNDPNSSNKTSVIENVTEFVVLTLTHDAQKQEGCIFAEPATLGSAALFLLDDVFKSLPSKSAIDRIALLFMAAVAEQAKAAASALDANN